MLSVHRLFANSIELFKTTRFSISVVPGSGLPRWIIFLRKAVEISLDATSLIIERSFLTSALEHDFNWDASPPPDYSWHGGVEFSADRADRRKLAITESSPRKPARIDSYSCYTFDVQRMPAYPEAKNNYFAISGCVSASARRNPLTIGVLLVNKIVDGKSIVNYANEGISLKVGYLCPRCRRIATDHMLLHRYSRIL